MSKRKVRRIGGFMTRRLFAILTTASLIPCLAAAQTAAGGNASTSAASSSFGALIVPYLGPAVSLLVAVYVAWRTSQLERKRAAWARDLETQKAEVARELKKSEHEAAERLKRFEADFA